VVLISVVIIGLIAIQGYWINNALEVNRERFESSVNEALHQVVLKLEKKATAARITRRLNMRKQHFRVDPQVGGMPGTSLQPGDHFVTDNRGKRILLNVQEEITTDSSGVVTTSTCEKSFSGGDDASGIEIGTAAEDYGRKFFGKSLLDSTNASIEWFARRKEFVNNVFDELVSINIYNDYLNKLDTLQIDSLLNSELSERNIRVQHRFGIMNCDQDQFVFPVSGDWQQFLKDSKFKIGLSPSNAFVKANVLAVYFPHEDRYLWRSMWWMLACSGTVIIIIIGVFFYTFNTIIEQKRLSEMKNNFINNMTHELKTPISTISLACEVLVDPSIQKTEQRVSKYVGMIRDENKRLGGLVEQVLQTALLDKGKLKLNMERIDFHDLIQQVLETMRLQMEARQTQLVLHLNAHPAHLMADRVHLGNVVQNLFDNALKYTEGQPHLVLDTYVEDNLLVLSVKDNGIGISRENQRRVFDNLFRVPTGNVHNVKGFGLGLSYVKAIVEKHGGRVALESELGKGSTFKIYLPFENPEASFENT